MPEHEVTIRYRVPLDQTGAHVHGLETAAEIISKLIGDFPASSEKLNIPYVRCGQPQIVRNDAAE